MTSRHAPASGVCRASACPQPICSAPGLRPPSRSP